MKKIICLLLMLVLCLGCFAACGKDDTDNTDDTNNGDNGDQGTTKTTAEEAKELLFAMYKDESSTTQADYEVVGVIKVGDKTCNIVWTVDVTSGVTVGAMTDKKMVPIDVDEEAGADIAYKLTATITDPEGNTATVVLDRTVPKFQVNTLEEYLAAKDGDALVVEGIISAMNSKSVGNKRNHLFLVDASGKGGYYIYQMDQDPIADLNLKVGMTVRVAGPAAPYSGMMEIKGGAVTKVIDTTEKTVEAVDISEEFLKEAPNFAPYVGMLVTVKGVTIGGQELGGSSDYLFFTKGAIKSYVRSYLTDLPTSVKEADKATIEAFHASKNGYVADVTGVVVLYSGAPYLMPVSAEPFTNVTLPERTDAEKVALEIGAVTVPNSITKDTIINLPLAGVTYPDGVKFAWTVDNDKFTISENGALEIKLGANSVKLKLTLTATCGEATETKTFEINVAASKVMSTTKPYYGYVNQVKAQKEIWLDGGVDGRYLTTTEDSSKAVAIYVEKAADGYKFYIVVDEVKQYITLYKNEENKDSLKYDAAGTTTFSYDPTVNAWMINDSAYYLGTYNKFTTISASTASYLNPENSGVENFPVNFDFARPGDAFNMSVAQNDEKVNKVVYVTGADDGRYLVTTENVADAAAVYAEKVAGGFKFYIVVEEAKLYLTVYKNDADKDAVKFAADGNSVFNYDGATNALVTDFNGTKYYIGTYSTYTTLSASKFSYINAENTGVSQFPVELVAIGTTEDPENPDPENPDPENPDDPGDTPPVPVDPDVINTYVSNDEILTLKVNETKKTVTFVFTPPTGNPAEATYNYTVTDGVVTLTDADGAAVNALMAAVTLTDDVLTSATWNGFNYSFVKEEEPAEQIIKVYTGKYNGVDMDVIINYTKETVTFSYTNPRTGMEVNEEYTYVINGDTMELSFDGNPQATYMQSVQLKNGVPVAATYTAMQFDLTEKVTEPEQPEEPEVPEEPEDKIDVTGKWTGTEVTDYGDYVYNLTIEGTTGKGTYEGSWGPTEFTITSVVVDGNKVTIVTVDSANNEYPLECVYENGVLNCEKGLVWGKLTLTKATEEPEVPEEPEEKIDVTGKWTGTEVTDYGNYEYTVTIDGTTGKGSYEGSWGPTEFTITSVVVDGNKVTIVTVDSANNEYPLECVYENGVLNCEKGLVWGKLTLTKATEEPEEPEENEFELTIEEAIKLGNTYEHNTYTTDKYYVSGVIDEIYDTQFGNMYIKDENGNRFLVYGVYSEDGTTRYDAMGDKKPLVGDTITVYGIIGKYGDNAQMKSGWLTAHTAHEHKYEEKVTEPTCFADGYTTHTCAICKDEYVDTKVKKLQHTTDNGVCDNCGQTIGGEVDPTPVTASKTVADLIKEYGWTDATTKQSFNLDAVVSVKIDGGNNTGKAYNGDHIRIYATDTPAGTMTITVPEGYELVSIKITTQTGTYAFFCVDGTTTDICNQTVEVSGNSVVLNSVKNGSNGKQVRVTAIEVVYRAVAL